MNDNTSLQPPVDCSCIQVEILIRESWINWFLEEKQVNIPVNDNIHLHKMKISLNSEFLNLQTDIRENENSSISLSFRPIWNPESQNLQIEDLKLQTKSKNLLLKSKAWFAQHFLNSKLDKQIEEQANLLYAGQLKKLKQEPVNIPIPKTGNAIVSISNIRILHLVFEDQLIRVHAMIEGFWKLELSASEL
jgi:hypothetical protein